MTLSGLRISVFVSSSECVSGHSSSQPGTHLTYSALTASRSDATLPWSVAAEHHYTLLFWSTRRAQSIQCFKGKKTRWNFNYKTENEFCRNLLIIMRIRFFISLADKRQNHNFFSVFLHFCLLRLFSFFLDRRTSWILSSPPEDPVYIQLF